MLWIEIACLGILAVYVVMHWREPGQAREIGVIAASAWIGEDTCIRAYDFYQYAPGWHAWLDRVPVLIVCIWPAIVLSARAIARSLVPASASTAKRALLVPLFTGALVLFDAFLIEPIAVHAGLWSWNEPGLFGVPWIGVLGWGFFATAIVACLEQLNGRRLALSLAIAPLFTHVALLASWWGALRWMLRDHTAPWSVTLVAAIAALALTAFSGSRGAVVSRRELVPRAVATSFFAVLLLRSPHPALITYALAFTPPHLLLCLRSMRAMRA